MMSSAREMAAAGIDIVVLGGVPIDLSRGAANDQIEGYGRLLREF